MEEILAILDAADQQIAQKPLAAEEIEKVRERLAETRAWIADEEADLLDDEAVAGMVLDGERLIATIDARDKTIAERDRALEQALAERGAAESVIEETATLLAAHDAEIRELVGAQKGELTSAAVRRAFGELRAAYVKGMDEIGVAAVEQIEGALRDGATGMRDACLILVTAAGQGQSPYVAAAMDALRKAIETLLVP